MRGGEEGGFYLGLYYPHVVHSDLTNIDNLERLAEDATLSHEDEGDTTLAHQAGRVHAPSLARGWASANAILSA